MVKKVVLPEGFEPPTKSLWGIGSTIELQEYCLVGQWGIDPPPVTDEIYSLAARATSFTDP